MGQITDREYRPESDLSALARIVSSATGESHDPDKVAHRLGAPGVSTVDGVRVWVDSRGTPVAFSFLVSRVTDSGPQERWFSRIPKGSPHKAELEPAILRWACRVTLARYGSSQGQFCLCGLVEEDEIDRLAFIEESGFQIERYFQTMRLRDLTSLSEPVLPDGFAFRHTRGAEDAEKYVDVFNDTWIDHYGFVAMTVDDYVYDVEDDPDFVKELDLVIEARDGRFVGFACCGIDPDDRSLGHVLMLGTRRGFRGMGLGRALLAHAIQTLQDWDVTQVELGVDTRNPTGAGQLYSSVGFEVIAAKRLYLLDRKGIARIAES